MHTYPERRQEAATPSERLDSWKEIGEYLKRDVRTVQRWEQTRGLPVHRVPGGGHAAVYALKPELDGWLASGRKAADARLSRSRRFVLAAFVTGVIAAAGGTIWWMTRSQPSGERPTLTRLTWDSGLTTDPALSPDGKLLAFASDRRGEGQLDIWVRRVEGGEPIRLTTDPADDREPAFSPDGSRIAFRSERAPPGIYVVPALGGEARLLVPDGRTPRYSPDGKWIAYWTGEWHKNSKIGVLPANGGPALDHGFGRQEFIATAYPVWSPDSRGLLFMARQLLTVGDWLNDWWVGSLESKELLRTGAAEIFRRNGLQDVTLQIPSGWTEDRIVFSAAVQEASSLWEVSISPRDWRIIGQPERLTFTTGFDTRPALSAVGRVAFASLTDNINVWSLPVDANRAAPTGNPLRLTDAAGTDVHPSVSSDGRKMAFRSNRSGTWDVWIKDLSTGQESALVTGTTTGAFTAMSSDGSRVAYQERATPGAFSYYMIEIDSRRNHTSARKVCEKCGIFSDLSADGQLLLDYAPPPRRSTSSHSIATGQVSELTRHTSLCPADPRFSPDQQWVAFHTGPDSLGAHIYVFPARPGMTEKDWIPITDGTALDREVAWSPDGNVLYWISERDGFRCLAARRLDAKTKRPLGEMFYVLHLHVAQRSMMHSPNPNMGRPAVAVDKIVFSLAERTGNIWMLKLPEASR